MDLGLERPPVIKRCASHDASCPLSHPGAAWCPLPDSWHSSPRAPSQRRRTSCRSKVRPHRRHRRPVSQSSASRSDCQIFGRGVSDGRPCWTRKAGAKVIASSLGRQTLKLWAATAVRSRLAGWEPYQMGGGSSASREGLCARKRALACAWIRRGQHRSERWRNTPRRSQHIARHRQLLTWGSPQSYGARSTTFYSWSCSTQGKQPSAVERIAMCLGRGIEWVLSAYKGSFTTASTRHALSRNTAT